MLSPREEALPGGFNREAKGVVCKPRGRSPPTEKFRNSADLPIARTASERTPGVERDVFPERLTALFGSTCLELVGVELVGAMERDSLRSVEGGLPETFATEDLKLPTFDVLGFLSTALGERSVAIVEEGPLRCKSAVGDVTTADEVVFELLITTDSAGRAADTNN